MKTILALLLLAPSLSLSNSLCDNDNVMVSLWGNPYINDNDWDISSLSVFLQNELTCHIGFSDLEKRKYLYDSFIEIGAEALNKSVNKDVSVEISQREAKNKMWEVFYKTLND